MTTLYKVTKPRLMSTGWIGQYVTHVDGYDYILLRFSSGHELKYKTTSITKISNPPVPQEPEGRWIVMREVAGTRPFKHVEHTSLGSARKEAIRLAEKHPGEKFIYLKVDGAAEFVEEKIYTLVETK